jgi:hypothetical protein
MVKIHDAIESTIGHFDYVRKEVMEVGKKPDVKLLSSALLKMKKQAKTSAVA